MGKGNKNRKHNNKKRKKPAPDPSQSSENAVKTQGKEINEGSLRRADEVQATGYTPGIVSEEKREKEHRFDEDDKNLKTNSSSKQEVVNKINLDIQKQFHSYYMFQLQHPNVVKNVAMQIRLEKEQKLTEKYFSSDYSSKEKLAPGTKVRTLELQKAFKILNKCEDEQATDRTINGKVEIGTKVLTEDIVANAEMRDAYQTFKSNFPYLYKLLSFQINYEEKQKLTQESEECIMKTDEKDDTSSSEKTINYPVNTFHHDFEEVIKRQDSRLESKLKSSEGIESELKVMKEQGDNFPSGKTTATVNLEIESNEETGDTLDLGDDGTSELDDEPDGIILEMEKDTIEFKFERDGNKHILVGDQEFYYSFEEKQEMIFHFNNVNVQVSFKGNQVLVLTQNNELDISVRKSNPVNLTDDCAQTNALM